MATKLRQRDIEQIEECHPLIQKLCYAAAADDDFPAFIVVDGARTVEEQRRNVAKGVSKTMRSRHIPAANGWSHAIDIAPLVNGKLSWDWQYYYPLADHMKRLAADLGVPIEWGGDWKSFKDGPHWQLPWSKFSGKTEFADNVTPDSEILAHEDVLKKDPEPGSGFGNFRKSIPLVLAHEGGYVNHPKDKGGPTNKGITLATFQKFIKPGGTIADLKALTEEQAIDVYKQQYWDAARCDMLPAGLDYAVFDFAVNSGPGRAIKFLQRISGATVDGVFGPETQAAANAMNTAIAIDALCDERLDYLAQHEDADSFFEGWKKRVARVRNQALEMVGQPAPPTERDAETQTPKDSKMGFLSFLGPLFGSVLGAMFPGKASGDKPENKIVGLFRGLFGLFTGDAAADESGLFGLIGKIIPGLQNLTEGGEGLGDLLSGGHNWTLVIVLFFLQMVVGNMAEKKPEKS